MLKKQNRFHGRATIKRVLRAGNVVRNRYFSVKYSFAPHRNTPRISVVVSKKIAKSAVTRNRIRRRMYESIRLRIKQLPPQLELVVIITSGEVAVLATSELESVIEQALQSANLNKTSEK
jgi:ribonuclease P protein component